MIKAKGESLNIIISDNSIDIKVYKAILNQEIVDVTPSINLIAIDNDMYKQTIILPNEDCAVIVKTGSKYSLCRVGNHPLEIFYPHQIENNSVNVKRYNQTHSIIEEAYMTYRGFYLYSFIPSDEEQSIIKINNSLETMYSGEARSRTVILNKNTTNLVAINRKDFTISQFISEIGAENIEIANSYDNGVYKNFIVGLTPANSLNDFSFIRTDGEAEETQPFFIAVKDIPNDIEYRWNE
jgi:hypothetical protein